MAAGYFSGLRKIDRRFPSISVLPQETFRASPGQTRARRMDPVVFLRPSADGMDGFVYQKMKATKKEPSLIGRFFRLPVDSLDGMVYDSY